MENIWWASTYVSIFKAIHELILIKPFILIQVRAYILLLNINLLYDENFRVSNIILFITLLRVELFGYINKLVLEWEKHANIFQKFLFVQCYWNYYNKIEHPTMSNRRSIFKAATLTFFLPNFVFLYFSYDLIIFTTSLVPESISLPLMFWCNLGGSGGVGTLPWWVVLSY